MLPGFDALGGEGLRHHGESFGGLQTGAPAFRADTPKTLLSSAAFDQLNADLFFEIADLPAKRGRGRIQLLLGRNRQTARVSCGDEIAKMPELHHTLPCLRSMGPAYKVFHKQASATYSKGAPYAW